MRDAIFFFVLTVCCLAAAEDAHGDDLPVLPTVLMLEGALTAGIAMWFWLGLVEDASE